MDLHLGGHSGAALAFGPPTATRAASWATPWPRPSSRRWTTPTCSWPASSATMRPRPGRPRPPSIATNSRSTESRGAMQFTHRVSRKDVAPSEGGGSRPLRAQGLDLALAGVVDPFRQDAGVLLRGVEALRVLGVAEVDAPLRPAVQGPRLRQPLVGHAAGPRGLQGVHHLHQGFLGAVHERPRPGLDRLDA